MGWFTSLFSSASSSAANARKKMAMSTHDAFSLPTSSPITASHPDAFARSGATTPDIESQLNTAYSYPPSSSSPTTYDYVPRINGRAPSTRQSSLLPMHSNAPLSPLPPYPSLEQTWSRIRNWLSREYPELGDTLNYGILPQDLSEVEMALGMQLPQAVRESYLLVDGQEAESSAGCSEGLFFGLTFLPLEDVLDEWRFWREVDEDPTTGSNPRLRELMQSIPSRWVRRAYSQRGWIPLVTDKAGNYLGVDMNPDELGSVGQVIVFGRDFDTKVVMWRGDGPAGWARWLAGFAEELESGEGFEMGHVSDGSEGSEDSVGYESYFYDGSGRTKGDGGGDSGAGLRLTGEYRGWSVLEAWADKSVKKWRESGQLPEPPVSPEPLNKASARVGLGMLDLGSSSSSGAEVPIPIVRSVEEEDKTPTRANGMSTAQLNGPPVLPTISVTKAPAPRPLELPSPRDLRTPSPIDSRGTSFDHDLERGRDSSFDEVEHPLSTAAVPVKSQSPTTPISKRPSEIVSPIQEATLVPLPPSDTITPTETPAPAVPDLLQHNESSEGVPITPIEPESSPVTRKLDIEKSSVNSDAGPSNSEPTPTEAPKAAPEEAAQDPDTTIRLIGGGGVAGITSEPEPTAESEHEPDSIEVASVVSIASTDIETASVSSKASKKPKHEKKKSFSVSLKKIGRLGSGSSKRNSKSDSKDKIGAP